MAPFWKRRRESQRLRCAAIVPAAGSSRRMNGLNKLLEPLEGVPILVRTLTSLQLSSQVDEIVVAAREEDMQEVSRLCKEYGIHKCTKVVRGGESRAHSTLLAALETSEHTELLAVHDGARPLVTPGLVSQVILAASRSGAAAPALPVKDTIKTVREDQIVITTPGRHTLRAVQTPQVIQANVLKAALQDALQNHVPVTDDCAAVERLGKEVLLIQGEEENIKITVPSDMIFAEAILRARREGRL